jgi:[ribosomal protein S18]-alanine N-acetyltransferase
VVEVRRATTVADVEAAAALLDGPTKPEAVRRFVGEPGHHMLVAYSVDRRPIGMVTGVEMTHPDKGTEMFLYELAVDEASQGQGVGKALVKALADLARDHGCYGMWVLTDADNAAALGAYRAADGQKPSAHVLVDWDLTGRTNVMR